MSRNCVFSVVKKDVTKDFCFHFHSCCAGDVKFERITEMIEYQDMYEIRIASEIER